MTHVFTAGEAIVRLVAEHQGPLEHADSVRVGVGGAELNVAIGLARLGHRVTFAGVIGDDPWGRRVARELNAEGVHTMLRVTPAGYTAAYVRERRSGALRRAHYLRAGSAGSQLTVGDAESWDLVGVDHVHLTGITPALSTTARDGWHRLARRAADSGARISLDVNYRSRLCSRRHATEMLREILPVVRVLIAGTDETALLLSCEPDDINHDLPGAVKELRGLLPADAEVVIKLGMDGSLHSTADGTLTRGQTVPVEAVDPVGAGDAFAAGYLSGWFDGLPPADRLRRAHAAAAFVVGSAGDWEGFPRRAELSDAACLDDQEVRR